MKKIVVLFATAVVAMAFAANASAQLSVGAGYGLASHTRITKTGNTTNKIDPLNMSGFYVNGTYEINFLSKNWGDLSVAPGLTYAFYGKCISEESYKEEGITFSEKSSRRDHYLDVPVHVKYAYNVIPGTLKLAAFAGPVFSFGLAATSIEKLEEGNDWIKARSSLYTGKYVVKSSVSEDNASGDEGDTNYSIFDLKLGVGISATLFEKLDFRVAYNVGLLNRVTEKIDGVKAISHTNVLQIGVAYNF